MNISVKTAAFEIGPVGSKYLKENLGGDHLVFCKDPLTSGNMSLAQDAQVLVTFIRSQCNKTILEQLPNLRLIATMSAGFDHIDLNYCRRRGIMVCNVPDYGSADVAEYTFALILQLAKKIYATSRFSTIGDDYNLGRGLKGKTIGVIGSGRIGTHIIKLAKAFGMTIVVYDPHKSKAFARRFGFRLVDLDILLSSSDIITFHCPLNTSTRKMINRNNIGLIKKGALLVSTARGGIIDTGALVYGLKNSIIAAAALDVLENEGKIINGENVPAYKRLKGIKNVILTHHHAYKTDESVQIIFDETIQNIHKFISGKPRNVVV